MTPNEKIGLAGMLLSIICVQIASAQPDADEHPSVKWQIVAAGVAVVLSAILFIHLP